MNFLTGNLTILQCLRQSVFFILCLFFLSLLCIANSPVSAQSKKDRVHQPVSFRLAYQLLHSTHATNFNGASIDADYHLSKHLAMGIGVQYAATHRHPDNGWVLTNLHLLPVYISGIYRFNTVHVVQPYLHAEAGISFNHYHKLDTTVSPESYPVSEEGLYLSGNAGASFAVRRSKLFVEMGYKGYKHSTNALNVNPHGFTVRAGIEL